jgi:hypothetical protein
MRAFVLLAAAFFSLATSSVEEGDRADGCPEDELAMAGCSPATPDGLLFRGAELGDLILSEGVQGLAVGGVQTIHVFQGEQPFALDYDAKSTSGAMGIDAVTANQVRVRGVSPGTPKLRLVEPGSDVLYDRKDVRVAEVDRVVVLPHQLSTSGDKDVRFDPEPEVVFHVDTVWWTTLGLFAADGTRLVDEGLTITPPAGFRLVANRWDGVEIDGAPAGEHTIGFTHASGASGTASITLVDRADAIVAVPGTDANQQARPGDGPIPAGANTIFCFRAELEGKPVIGAPLDFAGTGAVEAGQRADNCVTVNATGSGNLVVSLGDLVVAFPISVL